MPVWPSNECCLGGGGRGCRPCRGRQGLEGGGLSRRLTSLLLRYNTTCSEFFKDAYRKELRAHDASLDLRPATSAGPRPAEAASGGGDLTARSYGSTAWSAYGSRGLGSRGGDGLAQPDTSHFADADALDRLRRQLSPPRAGYKPRSRNLSPSRTLRGSAVGTPGAMGSPLGLSPSSTLGGPGSAGSVAPDSLVAHEVACTETTYGADFSARDPARSVYRGPLDKSHNRPRTERSDYAEILLGLKSLYNPSRK